MLRKIMIICSIFGYLLYSTCWKIRYFYFNFVVIFNVKNILACCLQRKRCFAIDVCVLLIPDSFVKSARWQQGNGTVLPVHSPPKKWIKSRPAVYARIRLFGMHVWIISKRNEEPTLAL